MIDHMSEDIVRALLETIPMETTVIDANDEVISWNKHETRLFHRPMSSMGLNFRACHPEESLPKVVRIVERLRSGERDTARLWVDIEVVPGKDRHRILIEFFALRDANGKYLGCLECAQDVQEIIGLKGQRRLLDEP
jgi:PAS domain S-box-containing protein